MAQRPTRTNYRVTSPSPDAKLPDALFSNSQDDNADLGVLNTAANVYLP